MSKMPDKYCIVTITCDDFCVGTEVLLYSFLKYNPWFKGDINIVVADLSDQSRERLMSIYPVKFIAASEQLIAKIEVLRDHFDYLRDIHLRFYSLEAFHMTGYDKVMYLDSDMYCSGDMKPLFLNEAPLQACLDGFSYEERIVPMIEEAGMQLEATPERYGKVFQDSFNAGVLVISSPALSKTNYEALVAMLDYEAWVGLGSSIFTDQMIINRHFEGQFSIISSRYNYMIFLREYLKVVDDVAFQDASMIHFAGKVKPWNNYDKADVLDKAPHYLKYIEVWREMLDDLRHKNNPKHQAQLLIDQFEWTMSGADQALRSDDRVY